MLVGAMDPMGPALSSPQAEWFTPTPPTLNTFYLFSADAGTVYLPPRFHTSIHTTRTHTADARPADLRPSPYTPHAHTHTADARPANLRPRLMHRAFPPKGQAAGQPVCAGGEVQAVRAGVRRGNGWVCGTFMCILFPFASARPLVLPCLLVCDVAFDDVQSTMSIKSRVALDRVFTLDHW